MVAYTTSAGAQLALMNPGGIRADLIFADSPGGEAPGQVTYGEVFTVQPFNNLVVTVTLTGAQLKEVSSSSSPATQGRRRRGSCRCPPGSPTPTPRPRPREPGQRDDAGRHTDRPGRTYRVSTNDFLANGGDGFTNLTVATDRVTAPGFDVDSLAAYVGAGPVGAGTAEPDHDGPVTTP